MAAASAPRLWPSVRRLALALVRLRRELAAAAANHVVPFVLFQAETYPPMYRGARADEYPNFPLGENGHRTDAPQANRVLKAPQLHTICLFHASCLSLLSAGEYRYWTRYQQAYLQSCAFSHAFCIQAH